MALLIAAMERCYLGSSSSQNVTSPLSSHYHHKRHFTFAFPFTQPPKFLQKNISFLRLKTCVQKQTNCASKWFSLFLGNSSNATNTTTPFYDLCVIWGATTKRFLALLLSLLMEGSQSMQWRRRRGVGSKKGTWCRKKRDNTHTHTQGRLSRLHFEEAAVSGSNINGKKFSTQGN